MPGVKKCEVVSTRDFIIRVTCEPQQHQPHADQVPGSRLILNTLCQNKNTEGNPSSRWVATGCVADPNMHESASYLDQDPDPHESDANPEKYVDPQKFTDSFQPL
jgi:hypothetical protein